MVSSEQSRTILTHPIKDSATVVACLTNQLPIPNPWNSFLTQTSSICPALPPPKINLGSTSKVVVPTITFLLSIGSLQPLLSFSSPRAYTTKILCKGFDSISWNILSTSDLSKFLDVPAIRLSKVSKNPLVISTLWSPPRRKEYFFLFSFF